MCIIPINEELKSVELLYIENDPKLRDIDRWNLESVLGGMGGFANLDDYKIEYHFNAYSSDKTWSKIKKAEFILLNTSFTGASGDLLYNFVFGALHEGLKDKKILNCMSLSTMSIQFGEMEEKIIKLAEEQNIRFYFPSRNMKCFTEFNNKEGFNLM